jgi:acyl-coenzyme A thioesterase PaaI-like protein
VIASLLDSAMTHCLFHQGIRALTGDLRVRYLRSVPMDAELVLGAWLVKKRAPLYYLQGEVRVGQQTLARAEATFMQQKEG